MIPDWLLAYLPTRKPCGCVKYEHDGPEHDVAEARFRAGINSLGSDGMWDTVEMRCHCAGCGGNYTIVWVWPQQDSPVPDPDEQDRPFNWCSYNLHRRFWLNDNEPDKRIYGGWDGYPVIETADD